MALRSLPLLTLGARATGPNKLTPESLVEVCYERDGWRILLDEQALPLQFFDLSSSDRNVATNDAERISHRGCSRIGDDQALNFPIDDALYDVLYGSVP